jgi:hypothetical protein
MLVAAVEDEDRVVAPVGSLAASVYMHELIFGMFVSSVSGDCEWVERGLDQEQLVDKWTTWEAHSTVMVQRRIGTPDISLSDTQGYPNPP